MEVKQPFETRHPLLRIKRTLLLPSLQSKTLITSQCCVLPTNKTLIIRTEPSDWRA